MVDATFNLRCRVQSWQLIGRRHAYFGGKYVRRPENNVYKYEIANYVPCNVLQVHILYIFLYIVTKAFSLQFYFMKFKFFQFAKFSFAYTVHIVIFVSIILGFLPCQCVCHNFNYILQLLYFLNLLSSVLGTPICSFIPKSTKHIITI